MVIELGKEYRGKELGQLLAELAKDGLHKMCVIDVTFFFEGEDCVTNQRIISELRKTDDGFQVDIIPAFPGPCNWGTFEAFWTCKEGVKENKAISTIKVGVVCLDHENKNVKRQNSSIEIGKTYSGKELSQLMAEIFGKGDQNRFVFTVTYFVGGQKITTERRNMRAIEKTETGFYISMAPNRPGPEDYGEFDMAWFEKDGHQEDGTIAELKITAMMA